MVNDQVTLDGAIAQVLDTLDGPISMQEFYQKVLEIRPSHAKNPTASIRDRMRYGWYHKIAELDSDTLIPMRCLMRGIRFAVPLSRKEVSQGLLLTYPAFELYLPREFPLSEVKLLDERGNTLPTRLKSFKETVETPLGSTEIKREGFELSTWFKQHKVKRGDYLLVTTENWERGHIRLEHEPAKARQRRQAEIAARNQEFADHVFDLLESQREEDILTGKAVPTALAQMSDPYGYPGDHWMQILAKDPRMRSDGWMIRYSDWRSPLESILLERFFEEEMVPEVEELPLSEEAQQQVYRFKAALKYHKSLWRRIEIQGGQTLVDFNHILVNAFRHDWDHMGGFWKRVRRGNTKRYRDIEMGDVDPMGGGSGADVTIASLDLTPGDTLKFVFDFGDWIEHILTLETITVPEDNVQYPRVIAQNRPRYRYCQSCKEAGRKTIATWICIECSNREGQDVLVCEDCLYKHHEDHYADEIVY
ncbi:MAG: hypothetical protein JXA33_15785 [Anaerolineae bacterium]|nr:hypothetical protein [Anaerolineae bacterium]